MSTQTCARLGCGSAAGLNNADLCDEHYREETTTPTDSGREERAIEWTADAGDMVAALAANPEAAEAELGRVTAIVEAVRCVHPKTVAMVELAQAEPAQPPPTPEFPHSRECPGCGSGLLSQRLARLGQSGPELCGHDWHDPPAPPAPTEAKLPGGFGPDYVTGARLAAVIRKACTPYNSELETLLLVADELERGGRER
jgi:hypothetical protein